MLTAIYTLNGSEVFLGANRVLRADSLINFDSLSDICLFQAFWDAMAPKLRALSNLNVARDFSYNDIDRVTELG